WHSPSPDPASGPPLSPHRVSGPPRGRWTVTTDHSLTADACPGGPLRSAGLPHGRGTVHRRPIRRATAQGMPVTPSRLGGCAPQGNGGGGEAGTASSVARVSAQSHDPRGEAGPADAYSRSVTTFSARGP